MLDIVKKEHSTSVSFLNCRK